MIKKRREESMIRMTPQEKRRLTFQDDFQSLSVSKLASRSYRSLMNYTFTVDGDFLQVWTYARVIMSTVIFVLTFLQVTYRMTEVWLFVVVYLLDVYAFVDMYIQFHVQYYNELNVLVTHPFMTAKRYLRSNFWMDLLPVMPIELVLVVTPGGTVMRDDLLHLTMYLRLNRCFQIYRVPLAFHFLVSFLQSRGGGGKSESDSEVESRL